MSTFTNSDLEDLWDDSDDAENSHYTEPAPTADLVAELEAELGFRLPASYVALAQIRNGGRLARTFHPTQEETNWADDHVAVTGLYAIGRTARYSIAGELGSTFMQEEWGYPPIGVCIADTPTAGHQVVMLDYTLCGPQGEPRVVYVDQEDDYHFTVLAPDFASFIRALENEEDWEDPEQELALDLATVEHGTLSPLITRALALSSLPDGAALVRSQCRRIVLAKGRFFLHDDGDSWLLYDLLFHLHSLLRTPTSFDDFFRRSTDQVDYERACFELMITTSFVAHPYGLTTAGFGEGFLRDWWEARVAHGAIALTPDGFVHESEHWTQVLRILRAGLA